MLIRDAERSDYPAIAALQIRSWRDVYRGVMPDDYLDHEIKADQQARWAELKPGADDLVLLAEDEAGRLLGFATVWHQPDPYVDNLHVEPALRSNGIGERLMRAVAGRLLAMGYDTVSLTVAAANPRAAAFYRRLGGSFGPVKPMHQRFGGAIDAMEVIWDDLRALAEGD
jgi:ribosomal protein S18 acetylase RimI-like enzyme